ncbi:hypothetical protein SAMN06297251_10132 [Fulvimarina manganoxydans]|uniref:Uncharacterized protein n=1 Tax=Fulvimarina manganoxydans TaxID=937218 RepID=A0A1W1Y9M2_9HYPH|nr:hypothetical protein [Fulvimarina manganoxydans]SMC32448.1 hypothetical protein SAMN06297251_10132 [Fulvimarina manganoxydans]
MVEVLTRTAKGAPLTFAEMDTNLTNLKAAIEAAAGGVYASGYLQDPESGDVTFVYSDGTEIGPITLPTKPLSIRGAWSPGLPYVPGDLVQAAGESYVVKTAHVAGDLAADVAAGRLVLLAGRGEDGNDGDPGDPGKSLRLAGAWTVGTDYSVLDLVSHEGSSYVAAADHVAGVFADDLAAGRWQVSAAKGEPGDDAEGGAGGIPDAPDDGKVYGRKSLGWEEIVHPEASGGGGAAGHWWDEAYRDAWATGVDYRAGDIVGGDQVGINDGLWVCVYPHTSNTASRPSWNAVMNGVWTPFGFPYQGVGINAAQAKGISHLLFHSKADGSVVDLRTYIRALETRIAALENA